MTPRAGAVVAEAEIAYWGGAIVVSVLAAGGMALATGDAQKVGSAMYAALKDTGGKAWDSIQAMAAWAASAGSKVKDAAFRVGKDVWQAITDCFNKSYSDGSFVISSSSVSVENGLTKWDWDDDTDLGKAMKNLFVWGRSCTYVVDTPLDAYAKQRSYSLVFVDNSLYVNGNKIPFPMTATMNFDFTIGVAHLDDPYFGLSVYDYAEESHASYCIFSAVDAPFTVSVRDSVSVSAGDLVYPGDDYLVKAPDLPAVDTATGAVSWPSDAVYNKDAIALPYPIDAAGQQVADIPYDVPVDQTTGKTLDDADTGTDTDKPGTDTDKPGTDTGGKLGEIIALLKNFFDSPSDFKLDMDGFRNLAIKDKFPFCIPFDMVDSVKQFAATAAEYEFRIDLQTQYFSVDHVVDLTPLAVPLAFFRYIVVTWFVWILLSRTRDLMKW